MISDSDCKLINHPCDRGFTSPGESVYISGNLPALIEGNPAKAIKLDPNVSG